MEKRQSLEAELVKEGVSSFLDALVAVREFSRIVRERSKKVLRSRLDDLRSALDVPLEESDIETVPSKSYRGLDGLFGTRDHFLEESWKGSVWVTAQLNIIKWNTQNRRELSCYCGLYFERGDVWATVAMGISPKDDAQFILARARNVAPQAGVEPVPGWDEGIWLRDELGPEQADQFELVLRELLDTWIKIWNQIGGVTKLHETV